MKIKITGCNNPHYWYCNHVGEVFNVVCYYAEDEVFLVRERHGYLNIVHKDSAEIVKEQDDAE